MRERNGSEYTLLSRLHGEIARNIPKELVPDFIFKHADTKTTNDFVMVVRGQQRQHGANGDNANNGWRGIAFREFRDDYVEQGKVWVFDGDSPITRFILTPHAFFLKRNQLLAILNEAEKAVEGKTPSPNSRNAISISA